MDKQELVDIFNAMDANGLLRQSHLLTGELLTESLWLATMLWVDLAKAGHSFYGTNWQARCTGVRHLIPAFIDSTLSLVTGYVPSPESLEAVSNMVDRLREINPELVYILDTVLGDDNKIYVAPECIDVYKTLLPKANCATPNHFEAE